MTRADILALYDLNELGIISSPGKFEGEPVYAPFFWDTLLEGGADEELEDGAAVFYVTTEERREFPELADIATVSLWETESGFIYISTTYRTDGL